MRWQPRLWFVTTVAATLLKTDACEYLHVHTRASLALGEKGCREGGWDQRARNRELSSAVLTPCDAGGWEGAPRL